jgi:hypothetical protein
LFGRKSILLSLSTPRAERRQVGRRITLDIKPKQKNKAQANLGFEQNRYQSQ